MNPTTGTIIKALRSGLATRDELLEHHGCKSEALTTCTSNMLRRELITRYAEAVDGKTVSAYRLTELGKAWKPDQRGVSLKKAMQKGMQPESGIGGTAIPPPALDSIFATAPELQYLSPEDYAMPEPDAKLLALANRELSAQLESRNASLLNACDALGRIGHRLGTDPDEGGSGPILCAIDEIEGQRDAWSLVAARFEQETPVEFAAYVEFLRDELTNARALADKLQHLLDAKTRECEALRANAPECCGKCAPDLETVPLAELVAGVASSLDDDQSITIDADGIVTIEAFGCEFTGYHYMVSALLDATETLRRAEVAA